MHSTTRWISFATAVTLALATTTAHAYTDDVRPAEREGATDPAFLPRLPDAVATDQIRRQFSEYQLPIGWDDEAGDWKTRPIDGRLTQTYYDHDRKTKPQELATWYLAHLKKHGFKVEFDHKLPDGARRIVASLQRIPVTVDLDVRPTQHGPLLTLTLVDGGEDLRPKLDAQALLEALGRAERVRLPDLAFEANGSVSPASALQLDEVAALLKLDPKLKIHLEVATDETGNPKRNLALSARQASALRAWLVKHHKLQAGRIEPIGLGEAKSAADGAQRWVELVREPAPVAARHAN